MVLLGSLVWVAISVCASYLIGQFFEIGIYYLGTWFVLFPALYVAGGAIFGLYVGKATLLEVWKNCRKGEDTKLKLVMASGFCFFVATTLWLFSLIAGSIYELAAKRRWIVLGNKEPRPISGS